MTWLWEILRFHNWFSISVIPRLVICVIKSFRESIGHYGSNPPFPNYRIIKILKFILHFTWSTVTKNTTSDMSYCVSIGWQVLQEKWVLKFYNNLGLKFVACLLFLHLSGTTIANWHFGDSWLWMKYKTKVRKSMCRIKQVLTERAIEDPDPRRTAEMKRMINALWWLPACVCSPNTVLGMFVDCSMALFFRVQLWSIWQFT